MRYTILDPTGNITGLVEDDVEAVRQPDVSAELMRKHPEVEQVGFVRAREGGVSGGLGDPVVGLRMAGGEFCGNATMCAAVWYAERARLDEGMVVVTASGASKPVEVRVERLADRTYAAAVHMPRAIAIEQVELAVGDLFDVLPLVRMEGISHVIIEPTSALWSLRDQAALAEQAVRSWCTSLATDGLGLMFLEVEGDQGRLTPLVYVPASGTVYWENSCASGSAAAGMYVGVHRLELKEPGGTLCVKIDESGSTWLHGRVCW